MFIDWSTIAWKRLFFRSDKTPLANRLSGITLIELLVVVAIIGVLMALMLPAVEMARESARKSSCANNLKQIALAIKLHEETHRIYPTGGWGADWVGDPDSGFGQKQPGGWVYNVLPYIEQGNLREIGSGLPEADKRVALKKVLETPLEIFQCPSRRLPRAYPFRGGALRNAESPEKAAKSDYAINGLISSEKSEQVHSYIQLEKGISNTLLVGEKSLIRSSYTSGDGAGDQLSMYVGDCPDIRRDVNGNPIADAKGNGTGFGGPHPGGCNVVYCDGSVHFIAENGELEPRQFPGSLE